MKKILLALLLLALLLAGSAPAYAGKSGPFNGLNTYTCTFDNYFDPHYLVTILRLPAGRALSLEPIVVGQDLIWQLIGGDLNPALPEVGSNWACEVEYYEDCSDWCVIVVEEIILVQEITP